MEEFIFYTTLGLKHLLDFAAYDHILFLVALVLPFTFQHWKKVLLLATIFTLTHCLSLYASVYGILVMNVDLVEFLIPMTIMATALFNLNYLKVGSAHKSMVLHLLATAFFGLIHGFGFSNYFKMLMAEEDNKLTPLLGFAAGIEIAQIIIVLVLLVLAYFFQAVLKVKPRLFILILSIAILVVTIPMLIATYPW